MDRENYVAAVAARTTVGSGTLVDLNRGSDENDCGGRSDWCGDFGGQRR